jgi:GGDEF domain-containing protein
MVAVAVRDAGARSRDPEADRALRALRARWRTASIANGWRFPSDWALPEVDTVCESLVGRQLELNAALASLARARAASGAGLEETLTDLAALHAVATHPEGVHGLISADLDATPARLIRVAALAWADESFGEVSSPCATDSLTGLATPAYLRTRLGEVYRQAARAGHRAQDSHSLLVITLDLSEVEGLSRIMAMVLVADVLREVFGGGESCAVLGPSVAAVLAEREPTFGDRALTAGWLLNERLPADPHLACAGAPSLRVLGLPDTEEDADQLLRHLGRA